MSNFIDPSRVSKKAAEAETEAAEDKKLETITVGFHGLMDLCGVYSEDRFSRKWMHGIQPKSDYFDVNDNGDGTYTIRGTPKSLDPARKD
jgi:hypothetical protein